MADDLKVYTNEVIEENPFPGGIEPVTLPESLSKDTFAPTTTKGKTFPKKRIAVELLSTALNTRSKKILQEFELQQSGGLKIGDFKQGISGDLRITPNGLTARDIAGLTTFAIDGSDGSAVFKGRISAGSIMTEGEVIDENGVTIIDSEGLISSANFSFDTVFSNTTQTVTDTTADLTGSSLTLVLPRAARVLIIATCLLNITFSTSTATCDLYVDIDGVNQNPKGTLGATHGLAHNTILNTSITTHVVKELAAGSHTIKLKVTATGSLGSDIQDRQLSYLVLGK